MQQWSADEFLSPSGPTGSLRRHDAGGCIRFSVEHVFSYDVHLGGGAAENSVGFI